MTFAIYKNSSFKQPYWFVIWSGSDKLAHSEMYSSKQNALNAIHSIANNALGSPIMDLTGE